jgi:hypothetical protein
MFDITDIKASSDEWTQRMKPVLFSADCIHIENDNDDRFFLYSPTPQSHLHPCLKVSKGGHLIVSSPFHFKICGQAFSACVSNSKTITGKTYQKTINRKSESRFRSKLSSPLGVISFSPARVSSVFMTYFKPKTANIDFVSTRIIFR